MSEKEWEQVIRRRGELIYKKNRQGLTEEERAEYESLEQIVDAVLEEVSLRLPAEYFAKGDGL